MCRKLLSLVVGDVARHVSRGLRNKAWGYCYDDGRSVEFHGPDKFYWHGRGCCVWSAKHQGWSAYLRHIGVKEYQIDG